MSPNITDSAGLEDSLQECPLEETLVLEPTGARRTSVTQVLRRSVRVSWESPGSVLLSSFVFPMAPTILASRLAHSAGHTVGSVRFVATCVAILLVLAPAVLFSALIAATTVNKNFTQQPVLRDIRQQFGFFGKLLPAVYLWSIIQFVASVLAVIAFTVYLRLPSPIGPILASLTGYAVFLWAVQSIYHLPVLIVAGRKDAIAGGRISTLSLVKTAIRGGYRAMLCAPWFSVGLAAVISAFIALTVLSVVLVPILLGGITMITCTVAAADLKSLYGDFLIST